MPVAGEGAAEAVTLNRDIPNSLKTEAFGSDSAGAPGRARA